MEFILTLFVIFIGITYVRRLEKRIEVQDDKIYTLEQLLNMNLVKKNGKEKTATQTTKGKAAKKA